MPTSTTRETNRVTTAQTTDKPIGSTGKRTHEGDDILTLSERTGFHWKTILNAKGNESLRSDRIDPTVLFDRDRIVIPEKRIGYETVECEQRHTFVRKGVPFRFRMHLNYDDKTLANTDFILWIDEHHSIEGTTDDEGFLNVPLPVGAKKGRLEVYGTDQSFELELSFGELDPVESIRGVQMRLSNLGYDPGPPDGRLGPNTCKALEEFQNHYGLSVTGVPDEETREALLEHHGS